MQQSHSERICIKCLKHLVDQVLKYRSAERNKT